MHFWRKKGQYDYVPVMFNKKNIFCGTWQILYIRGISYS
jgi:hypothetical protein